VKVTTHLHVVPKSKNACNYTSTPQYAFMAWFLVNAQGQLIQEDLGVGVRITLRRTLGR